MYYDMSEGNMRSIWVCSACNTRQFGQKIQDDRNNQRFWASLWCGHSFASKENKELTLQIHFIYCMSKLKLCGVFQKYFVKALNKNWIYTID
mmetsp:Transcript_18590/g.27254  ORF Transcript_18590/g.27254 Transcript_18590/m.27254 type:complete len:92 (+) Transcript_18590:1078-1353(+)